MRVALIHANDGTEVRVGKLCRSLGRSGHEVHFVGWDRRPAEDKTVDLGGTVPHVMVESTPFGRFRPRAYIRYIAHVLRTLRRLRPQVVHVVNEDITALLLPFRRALYDRLICDMFDALDYRHTDAPLAPRIFFQLVSAAARLGADRIITTDEDRAALLSRYRAKMTVLCNYPEDPGDEPASRYPTGPIRLCVAGALCEERGLRGIVALADRVENLEILSAGWLYDEYSADTFVNHPKVRFEGIVSPRRSLELAASCDAVHAFYEPRCAINKLASPNKVYDALAVGRPVLMNSEVRLARWVEERGVGLVCPYDDVDALVGIVEELRRRRASIDEHARRLRGIFLDGFGWEQMEERLAAVYRDIETGLE